MTVLVVAAVLLCWTPHSIILLLLSTASPTPPYLHLLSTTLLNIYTVLVANGIAWGAECARGPLCWGRANVFTFLVVNALAVWRARGSVQPVY